MNYLMIMVWIYVQMKMNLGMVIVMRKIACIIVKDLKIIINGINQMKAIMEMEFARNMNVNFSMITGLIILMMTMNLDVLMMTIFLDQ